MGGLGGAIRSPSGHGTLGYGTDGCGLGTGGTIALPFGTLGYGIDCCGLGTGGPSALPGGTLGFGTDCCGLGSGGPGGTLGNGTDGFGMGTEGAIALPTSGGYMGGGLGRRFPGGGTIGNGTDCCLGMVTGGRIAGIGGGGTKP